ESFGETSSGGRAEVCESAMEIERNKRGRLDVRNKADELGKSEVKGKEVNVKNDVDDEVMNQVGNDYANDKKKTKISESLAGELVENYADLGIGCTNYVGE
ncbi:2426_t:CDS:2, partial [Dentiscutata erythropus]